MMLIFAVRDSAVESFGTPIFQRTAAEATRSLSDEVNGRGTPNSAIKAHPEDYILYELGAFNQDTGVITPQETPQQVARAKDLIERGD